MTLTTERGVFYASAEAELLFARLCSAVKRDLDGYRSKTWPDAELGTRIDGRGDPMEGLDFVASCVMALGRLRELRLPAYLLVLDVVEHGWPWVQGEEFTWWNRWHNAGGTGYADRLGLAKGQSHQLLHGSIEWLWYELASEREAPEQVLGLLRG